MRPEKTDFKGKFWVGQRVRIDLVAATGCSADIFACNTGVIRDIHGQFLKTPELTRIVYDIRIDGDKLVKKPIITQASIMTVEGEYLQSLENL